MAQAKQDMGSGSVKKLMLQLMIPAVDEFVPKVDIDGGYMLVNMIEGL